MKTILLVAILAIAGCAFLYNRGKKRLSSFAWEEETVEGTLQFNDVVAFFQNKSFQKNQQALVIKGNSQKFKEMVASSTLQQKAGYQTVVLGIYDDETNCIIDGKVIYAKSLDQEFQDKLGKEDLIVLT